MAQVQTSSARLGNTEAPECILIDYLSLLKAVRSGQQRLLVTAVSSHLEESSAVSIKDPTHLPQGFLQQVLLNTSQGDGVN